MKSNFVTDLSMNRRKALKASLSLGIGAAGLGMVSSTLAKDSGNSSKLDYSNPQDNLYAFGKLWSSYDEPCIGAFHGLMYLRIPGKRMVPMRNPTQRLLLIINELLDGD